MATTKMTICPYCGETQAAGDRCKVCGGFFEPLSRRATHNTMGPWFIRNPDRPFQPGCSYEMLVKLIERGQATKYTIIRGPTTKQFWTVAKHVPGVAHILGYCHNCDASVDAGDHGCHACGVPFGAYLDRNFMGLPDVQPLPWQAGDEQASRGLGGSKPWQPQRLGERISSFASDDELRAAARPAGAARGEDDGGAAGPKAVAATSTLPQAKPAARPVAAPGARSSQPAPAPASAPAVSAADFPDSPLARGMRRRIASQKRTIRMLSIMLIACGFVAITELVLLVQAQNAAAPVNPGVTGVHGAGDASSASAAGGNAAPPTSGETGGNTATTNDGAANDATSGGEATTEPAPDPFAEEYQRAQILIEAAENEQEQLAVRISDCEEAVRILEKILAEAPEESRPADLAEQIERLKGTLERLRLREFFPG